MNRKILPILLGIFIVLSVVNAYQNPEEGVNPLWYIGFGVGLILLALLSEFVYRLFASAYTGESAYIGPVLGKVDEKDEMKKRKAAMAKISEEKKIMEEEWERVAQTVNTKKLFGLLVRKGEIRASDAAKELEVDMLTLAKSAEYLKKNGFITIDGDLSNPYLRATKVLMERVRRKGQ